jgi:hypothetical protein
VDGQRDGGAGEVVAVLAAAAQHMHVSDIEELPKDGSRAWLLVQFGADTEEESAGTARRFAEWLTAKKGYDEDRILVVKSAEEIGQSQDIWEIREGGLGSTAFARGEDDWPGWEDSAVPPSSLGPYVTELRALMDRHGIKGALYGPLRPGVHPWPAQLRPAHTMCPSYQVTREEKHSTGAGRACCSRCCRARSSPPAGSPGRSSTPSTCAWPARAARTTARSTTPVVGMEPSCLAVFKDELRKLLPHDDDAARLARNTYHFGEFFSAFGISPPAIKGRALLWGHCHQRATGGVSPDQDLLEQMGLAVDNLQGGCCGLAGSWGFKAGKYGISMDCGEQALLPAVRQPDPDTLIVSDGFSGKTQIADAGTGRHALHLAEVMQTARAGAPAASGLPRLPMARRVARVAAVALTAVTVLGATAAAIASRSGRRRPR